jgi:misacylated tRNA(Ala) deacylase
MSMKETDPRMHSAEHLLTGVLVKMFGIGRPFTTHLEKKKSKADYRFTRTLSDEEARKVEAMVNEQIDRDLAVREEFLPRADAERSFNLSRLPEEAGETVRIVHIGDFDACPCSGAHVTSSSEIGRFRLISWSFENEALRIRFRLDPQ